MFSLPCSPSLESIASSASSLPIIDEDFKLDPVSIDPTCTISPVQHPATERPAYSEHARFFLPAENIFFVVANTLYSVPRSPFERHSSAFAGKGLTRENPMVLEDVAAAHLDNFLSLLYPSEYGVYTVTSVEEWTSILHLAVRWGFESIKNLSIECLSPIASDIDKIVLGRQYAIDEWLGDAYLAICSRDQCLSREEGMRMEKEDIIEISAIRHQFGLGALSKVALPLSIGEVRVRFGLAAAGGAVSDTGSCEVQGDPGVAPAPNLTPSAAVIDTAIPPEPKKPSEKADLLKQAREAAALELAERAKDREMTQHAVHAFCDKSQISSCYEADGYERERLRDAVDELRKEISRQKLLDFLASYKAANSELH
ncbi:hypothetical protein FIBSPDRAFT_1035811 [Athelia psychrophila]|uniref:BTB domain-containing protein n=1 Tax=Athelia psychrophila TaxID=1759441 RepID=A0A166WJQ9_9AGAM|nr:hypothetical protein FIBSPDRAFT_1035811 [Fibularhizoctonia sp. CBS 109695]